MAVSCALIAGTIGTHRLCSVKRPEVNGQALVNGVAFIPYLMPSIAVGAALFIMFSNEAFNLFITYALLIIAGTIKYIPFTS